MMSYLLSNCLLKEEDFCRIWCHISLLAVQWKRKIPAEYDVTSALQLSIERGKFLQNTTSYPLSLFSNERVRIWHHIRSSCFLMKMKISAEYDVIFPLLFCRIWCPICSPSSLTTKEDFCRIWCHICSPAVYWKGKIFAEYDVISAVLALWCMVDSLLEFVFLNFFWWDSRIMYLLHSSQLKNISYKKVSSSLYNVVVPDTVADPGSTSQNVKNKGSCSWQ